MDQSKEHAAMDIHTAGVYLRIVQIPNLIMNVTHEDIGDDVRRETVDDLVEKIRAVREAVRSVPTCDKEYVSKIVRACDSKREEAKQQRRGSLGKKELK